jgi:ribosomal protein L4
MSGDNQRWAALDSQNERLVAALESQHERLVGVSRPQLCGDVPGSGRKPWHRRVAEVARRADGGCRAKLARH